MECTKNFDASRVIDDTSYKNLLEDRSVKLVNGRIDEGLAPYESKVYEIIPQ